MTAAAQPEQARSAAAANAALSGEHAAVYAYGVVGSRLERSERLWAVQALSRHQDRRDALSATIAGSSGSPAVAEPAYRLPFPAQTRAQALRLAILVEDRLAALYLAVIVASSDRQLRATAAAALQATAADAARWRVIAGAEPVTVAFPGR